MKKYEKLSKKSYKTSPLGETFIKVKITFKKTVVNRLSYSFHVSIFRTLSKEKKHCD